MLAAEWLSRHPLQCVKEQILGSSAYSLNQDFPVLGLRNPTVVNTGLRWWPDVGIEGAGAECHLALGSGLQASLFLGLALGTGPSYPPEEPQAQEPAEILPSALQARPKPVATGPQGSSFFLPTPQASVLAPEALSVLALP